jgi:hypothetical protein
MVRLPRADMSFHGDCWAVLHLNVQREYELRAQDQGVVALLLPYNRAQVSAWLPSDAEEEAEGAELSGVPADPGEDPADEAFDHEAFDDEAFDDGAAEAVEVHVVHPDADPGPEAVAS